jgi:hypothetical protein
MLIERCDPGTLLAHADRARALGWTVAQTVAWMFESTHLRTHLDPVRWLLEARR